MEAPKPGHYKILTVEPPNLYLTRKIAATSVKISDVIATDFPRDTWTITNDLETEISTITNDPTGSHFDNYEMIQKPDNQIIIYPPNQTDAQKWKIIRSSDNHDYWNIIYAANQDYAATTFGDDEEVNVRIELFSETNKRQQWILTPE